MGFYGGEREEFGGKLLGGHLHENVVGKHGGERRSGGIKRSGLRFYSLFFFSFFLYLIQMTRKAFKKTISL